MKFMFFWLMKVNNNCLFVAKWWFHWYLGWIYMKLNYPSIFLGSKMENLGFEQFALLNFHLFEMLLFCLMKNFGWCRCGFYHDPIAGWYYSTRDGLYYKFEDGNYILLASYNKVLESFDLSLASYYILA